MSSFHTFLTIVREVSMSLYCMRDFLLSLHLCRPFLNVQPQSATSSQHRTVRRLAVVHRDYIEQIWSPVSLVREHV